VQSVIEMAVIRSAIDPRDTAQSMSEETVEVVQALFRALDSDDYAAALQLFDPDVVWRPTEGTYRGLEGLGASLIEWLEPWDEHHIDAEGFADLGERVLAEVHLTGRGEASGMTIDQRFFQLYRVDGGLIKEMDEFLTRGEALEAAEPRT
jgi:ketosteroid isomerase-like protein